MGWFQLVEEFVSRDHCGFDWPAKRHINLNPIHPLMPATASPQASPAGNAVVFLTMESFDEKSAGYDRNW